MKKIPFVPQHDESDCGVACLASVLLYYGKYVSLRKIREHCGTDKDGTSGYGILKGAEHFGLYCKCAFSKEKDFSDMPLPAIFLLRSKTEHYVVVYKITNSFVFMSDPDLGYRKLPVSEFKEKWSGVFLSFIQKLNLKRAEKKHGLFHIFLSWCALIKK